MERLVGYRESAQQQPGNLAWRRLKCYFLVVNELSEGGMTTMHLAIYMQINKLNKKKN
jgi:hypothetical protein